MRKNRDCPRLVRRSLAEGGRGLSHFFLSNLAITYILTLLFTTSAFAEEMEPKAPIVVNGDKVEYFHEEKKVVGTGNISIDYKDVKLTSEKVTVYLDTREAIAEGNVKITQKDNYFTGDRMNYNFDKRTGKAIDAYINYVPFYGRSRDVEKVSENQTNIERGYVTTCDLDKPHYRIQAKQVKIYTDDKLVAKHILFFVGSVPIMYLPYYVQPLKDRSSGITTMLGHDADWGYYALSSLKFDYSQIFKGRFRFDYRSKNGIAAGIDNSYTFSGLGDGIVKFYYAQENDDNLSYKPIMREEGKYRLQVRHKWQVNEDTLATVELNKVRDDNFMKYYFEKEWEEQGQPDNYVSFITTKENYTATFLARTRLDKYYDVVQRLPEYSIDIPNYNIPYNGGSTPLYYNMQSAFAYLEKTFRDNSSIGPMQKDQDVIRLDMNNKLSYTAQFFKALNVTPYAATRQTFYSRNAIGRTNIIRGAFNAGVDNSIKFYKVYDIKTDALGLDINRLRHVVTPTANYYYTHQPTVSRDHLMQFDGIDSIVEQNGILLTIENKLQTKRNEASVDIVDFIISTDYQFKFNKNVFPAFKNSDYKRRKFTFVDMQLELTPYPWLYVMSKMRIDTKQELPASASIDFVGGKEVDRSLSFGYRWERSFDSAIAADPDTNGNIVNYLTTDLIYRLNEFWKARIYYRANLNKGY
ncbi:MAG: LPS export ABC transporter periplasmic protein LptC, partial [Candidatus Omnitrophota bacterium]|nr:LPS export ABC transporter periplasmic protein LptC [Candidatus Omnitrophota bacterium]